MISKARKQNNPSFAEKVGEQLHLAKVAKDLLAFKDEAKTSLDLALDEVNTATKEANKIFSEINKFSEKIETEFAEVSNELVGILKDIKTEGLKGEDGESYNLTESDKAEIAKNVFIDVDEIAKRASFKVKPTPANLKIIKESIDFTGDEIVPKLNEATNLEKLRLTMANIIDWDNKWTDIKTEISRNKGGYHGGGFSNISSGGSLVTSGLDTLNFIGATVTKTGRTVNVEVESGGTPGGSTTEIQYNNAGSFGGSPNLIFDFTNTFLRINGTPTGALNTDKLQVNGNALIAGYRFSPFQILSTLGTLRLNSSLGGSVSITSSGSATADGGTVAITTGSAFGAGFTGGNFDITTGTGSVGGAGGNLNVIAGSAGGAGGSCNFTGGSATDIGGGGGGVLFVSGFGDIGGTIYFAPGTGTTTNGDIVFADSALNTVLRIFDNDMYFGTYTAGVVVQAGYITIRDSGGTIRRLLVG